MGSLSGSNYNEEIPSKFKGKKSSLSFRVKTKRSPGDLANMAARDGMVSPEIIKEKRRKTTLISRAFGLSPMKKKSTKKSLKNPSISA
mmetsp:Transcript_36167/g.55541  ORF Transcript_36167/g.55541 Transcript_36167/m.55541 type:complete len:88 (-) Transcript_36167:2484-2747(-)